MPNFEISNQGISRHERQHYQEGDGDLWHPFSIKNGQGIVVVYDISFHILKVLDHFPYEYNEKEEDRMDEYHRFEIPIKNKDRKERSDRQYGWSDVANDRNPLEFMRIEPDSENIEWEKDHCPKRHVACKDHRDKIQNKIGG